MTTLDWLTLAAIIVGPIVAVLITLWIEGRRRKRDGRMIILRQMMATRHLPADPMWSTAVNLIPVEFNDDRDVTAAYKAYQETIRPRQVPPEELETAFQLMVAKQTKMIFAVMRSLGLKASEADLPIEAYAARGMIERDNLLQESWRATIRIAGALERQLSLLERTSGEELKAQVPNRPDA